MVLPQNLKEIFIGLLLGDGNLQKRTENGNTILRFRQGLVHEEYIKFLFYLFKDYCPYYKIKEQKFFKIYQLLGQKNLILKIRFKTI